MMSVFRTNDVCQWPEYKALMEKLGVSIQGVIKQEIILEAGEPVRVRQEFYPATEEKKS